MDLNEVIAGIPPSASLEIDSKAKALKEAGEDVCGFGAGEPDFDTPAHIKEAAAAALREGKTKYCPNAGVAALQEAIVEKLKRENGLTYSPKQILVSNGAKHSLFNIFMALCRPGDEVLIPGPYWLSYPEMVRIAGGVPVVVPSTEATGFKITPADLEARLTPRSRALVINSPSNPTGAMYTPAEMKALAGAAVRRGLWIVSDEIYEKTVYDGAEQVSVGALSPEIFERTITVNGFSKAYAMTGWRLGYFAAPLPLFKAAANLQSHSTSGPNTFAQYGGIAALRGPQDFVGEMLRAFAERRAYLHRRLSSIPGVSCAKPAGAFYMFANIASLGLGSKEFSARLLDVEKVAVVPGVAFGDDRCIRFSYACSMATIEKGMDRLARFCARLKG